MFLLSGYFQKYAIMEGKIFQKNCTASKEIEKGTAQLFKRKI